MSDDRGEGEHVAGSWAQQRDATLDRLFNTPWDTELVDPSPLPSVVGRVDRPFGDERAQHLLGEERIATRKTMQDMDKMSASRPWEVENGAK